MIIISVRALTNSDSVCIFSFKLLLSNLYEQKVIDIMVAVDSSLIVFLEDLVSVTWTVHVHLGHLLHELVLAYLMKWWLVRRNDWILSLKVRHSCAKFGLNHHIAWSSRHWTCL